MVYLYYTHILHSHRSGNRDADLVCIEYFMYIIIPNGVSWRSVVSNNPSPSGCCCTALVNDGATIEPGPPTDVAHVSTDGGALEYVCMYVCMCVGYPLLV